MKKKLLTVLMAGVLCVVPFTAGCGNQEKKEAQEAVDGTFDTIEETVNAGAEDLEIPESTGDMDAVTGEWVIDYLEDADGNVMSLDEYAEATGLDAEQINAIYTLSSDGTSSVLLSGIDTQGVWSIDENGTVTVTMPTGSMNMTYYEDDDCLLIYDANSGLSTYLMRS